ncbi:MAG: GTP 3',8-cyclase MoaA, partial [Desulfobacterales bacterium]
YAFAGAPGKVGFIAPLSRHFCETCNRFRLTADGKLRACLFSEKEVDIKGFLRKGASMQALSDLIKHVARNKPQQHHLNDIAPKIPTNRTMRAIGG